MFSISNSLKDRLLPSIDIFGHKLSFLENNSNNIYSYTGIIFSFAISVFIIAVSTLFGREIFLRENPISSISNSIVKDKQIYLKDYPIMFTVKLANGQVANPFEYFNIDVIEYDYFKNGTTLRSVSNPIKECNPDNYNRMFKNFVSEYIKINAYAPLCLDHISKNNTGYFSNEYADTNSRYYLIRFMNFIIMYLKYNRNPYPYYSYEI